VTLLPSNGTFMSWGLTVPRTSGFALQVEGTLRFFNDMSLWPTSSSACVFFEEGSSGLVLAGSGLIDGQGAAWWPCAKDNCFRPYLVIWANQTTEVLVANVSLLNSPNHNLCMWASNVEVMNVTITAPDSVAAYPSHNTDGVDVLGNGAYIHHNHISVGDDHIAIHASDTLISDCVFGTGHGVSIGSLGMDTYLQNITVRDSITTGAAQAYRIKSDSASTGYLTDVLYTNLTAVNCNITILIMPNYNPQPVNSTLQISNVTFSNIMASGSLIAGQIDCSPSAPCEQLLFQNIQHTTPPPDGGWSCSNAHGIADDVSPSLSCLQT
jgi:polygalacturonase